MKIVYLLTSLGIGGAERQALALAERMKSRGHEVALMVLAPRLTPEQEWPTRFEVVSLGMRRTPTGLLGGLARGTRFLHACKPDLVHSHSFHANLTARLLRLACPAIPVVCTFHNVYEGGRGRMLAYRLTDSLSQANTAVSEAVARRFIELKTTSARQCAVVPNGINVADFVPSAERRIAVRQTMNLGEEFVWLASGRIVPAKDYLNLLRAFAQVRAERMDTVLWIAGEAVSASTAAEAHVLEAELCLGGAVQWLGLRRDMPALLDAADGFVSASAWEGMPLAVGEAMAMQKPIVATDAGGTRELAGDAGSIVPARDALSLARAMLQCMNRSVRERESAGRAARERIAKQFSMDARAEEWEAIYSSILRGRRGRLGA